MQIFFDSLAALNRFTLSLNEHNHQLVCPSCQACGQFAAHGFRYKQRSQTYRDIVGKRIICSNRRNASGCGKTIQLYLAQEIPRRQNTTTALAIFITELLANVSVTVAYAQVIAKNTLNLRHAWRWFKKLMQQLMTYRTYLNRDAVQLPPAVRSQSRARQLLLPTLSALFSVCRERNPTSLNDCAAFQYVYQTPIL